MSDATQIAASAPAPAATATDPRPTATAPRADAPVKILARDVNVYYGEKHALKNVDLDINEHQDNAQIGP